MKKVLNLIKKNYIAFTIFIVVVLVLLASVITIGIINHNRNKIVTKTDTHNLYQYIGTMKNAFTAELTYEDDKITKVSSSKYSIVKSIIYYQDEAKAIIPFDSEIIFYYRDNLTYRLPKYSFIKLTNYIKSLGVNGKEYDTNNFIIYDGIDYYFLPDESILTIDGQSVTLSPLSYVNANRATLTYYDYENDLLVVKENIKVANLKINNVDIDLFGDVVVYNKKTMMIDNDVKSHPIYSIDKED